MVTQHDLTLRDLRLQKNLSHEQVVKMLAEHLGQPEKSRRASVQWEFRGIKQVDILLGLAALYDLPLEYVRQAAENTRRNSGHPHLPRGRRPRNTSENPLSQ